MRVLIAGIDGYLGWTLAQYLVDAGHEVAGIDNYSRRSWVAEMDSWSAIPIAPMSERLQGFHERYREKLTFYEGDLQDYSLVEKVFNEFEPNAVVHLGECPSAPYSMIDRDHAVYVQTNNINSTFNLIFAIKDHSPETHLVKLGTMGEYGTPNTDIPEGFFDVEYRGRRDRFPYPRQAPSWYHWSKVHGSNNIMFACKTLGISATDIMQGVVFGTQIEQMGDDPRLSTRLDFDQAFGTAINRFACQAVIEHPLTPYGKGSQQRGFIPLRESMKCLKLAIENPAAMGEYRVFNQFAEVHSIDGLARTVQHVASGLGLDVEVKNLENPRMELEEHYYNPDHSKLRELGYTPTQSVEDEVRIMLSDLIPQRDRIEEKKRSLLPVVQWGGYRSRSGYLSDIEAQAAGGQS